MAKKVTNFSDLIQRVTASCLLHPLGNHNIEMTPDRFFESTNSHQLKSKLSSPEDEDEEQDYNNSSSIEEEEEEQESGEIYEDARETEEELQSKRYNISNNNMNINSRENEAMWMLMGQVFDSISAMKKAYGKLQEAHNPWDPEKMRVADTAVVAELRRLGVLRERFRRGGERLRKNAAVAAEAAETVSEVVAPYEAAVEELKKEVKVKEVELEELRQKVNILSVNGGNGNGKKNGRSLSRKKGGSFIQHQVPTSPTPDMFEATMKQVRDTSKSFTAHLLSLMRSAHWDLSAAVRSIEAAISTTGSTAITSINPHQHQTKHALESYVLRKIFLGFDHETFYMDGTLFSLLNPSQFRNECFSKFKDMKSMDPSELLGILPNSPFGVFCSKKYQEIVHPKMEESLFGNQEQRNQLLSGKHPRTQFYFEFLGLAKAIWLLHLLAFALDPPPSHFEASRGAEFHPVYMESVLRYPGGKVPSGQVVGFPVSPGFKLGNGSVIKARVYLVPRN
ncbi:unnamed protein product [Amaranthus hypochondriacus]